MSNGDNVHSNGDLNRESCNGVIIAEPDSTTPNYSLNVTVPSPQAGFGNNMIMTPCGWPSPCRAPPQPHIVKAVNLMMNKSVKHDCSDLPLSDLETLRFFFNLGIDVGLANHIHAHVLGHIMHSLQLKKQNTFYYPSRREVVLTKLNT